MSDGTRIAWTDATWNPITGCSPVSPACTNCYAARLAGTRLRHHPSRAGLTRNTKAGPVWTGEVRFNEEWLTQPLLWKRPRRIFVCAHSDLFHEAVPDEWIDRVFAVMGEARQHVFQILTKRPERMRDYLSAPGMASRVQAAFLETIQPNDARDFNETWPLPNVWIGVTAEDQRRADERIPLLLGTSAAKRFVSIEPMLGGLDIAWALSPSPLDIAAGILARGSFAPGLESLRHLDWVICGGESGPDARPMHPDWVRSLRDQCQAAGVPFFFKQWGEWLAYGEQDASGSLNTCTRGEEPHFWHEWGDGLKGFSVRVGKRAAGRLLDGREWLEMPNV